LLDAAKVTVSTTSRSDFSGTQFLERASFVSACKRLGNAERPIQPGVVPVPGRALVGPLGTDLEKIRFTKSRTLRLAVDH